MVSWKCGIWVLTILYRGKFWQDFTNLVNIPKLHVKPCQCMCTSNNKHSEFLASSPGSPISCKRSGSLSMRLETAKAKWEPSYHINFNACQSFLPYGTCMDYYILRFTNLPPATFHRCNGDVVSLSIEWSHLNLLNCCLHNNYYGSVDSISRDDLDTPYM